MAQRPVPRAEGEPIRNIGFAAPQSLERAMESRAAELGVTKSELIRAALQRFLDEPRRGVAA